MNNRQFIPRHERHNLPPPAPALVEKTHESADGRKTITFKAIANHRGDVCEIIEQPNSHGGQARPHRVLIPADLIPDAIEALYASLNAFNAANGKPAVTR